MKKNKAQKKSKIPLSKSKTTLNYKSSTKQLPVVLCTTKLAQTTSQYYFVLQRQSTPQYYFVLQGLHQTLSSTTLYYKACTKQLRSTTLYYNLAQTTSQYYFVLQRQNTSQYYFVLQGSHKTLPSTTLYYKACTNHFPVLLCTTKLAQSTPQYYFVLQKLHRTTPNTTLYYKACTKHSPVLLCTTKVAQRTSSTTLYYKACTKHSAVLLCTSVSLTTNLYKWLHTGEWV